MNLYDLAIRRGSGRTTRMLKGVIADAPNHVTIVGATKRHCDEMKRAYVRFGGDPTQISFVALNEGLYGASAVEVDHFAMEHMIRNFELELREQIAQEIEAMRPTTPGWYENGDAVYSVAKEQAAKIARAQE